MHEVSATALWTAAARARESARDDAIVTDDLAAALAGDEGFALFERYDNAGVGEFVAVRTRYLDEVVGRSRARQVVLLAAGFDTRSVRLGWREGTVLYELDHTDLVERKEKRLAELGARHRCDRRPVGTDLAGDWPADLRAAGWDAAVPTLWLVEGLLFYLTRDAARSLLTTVAGLGAGPGAGGSVLAGDLLSHQSMVSEFTRAGMERLRADGSPWLFGTDEPEDFLAGCGWQVTDLRTPGEEGAAFGRWPWPPLPREVTGFPRNFLFTATPAPR